MDMDMGCGDQTRPDIETRPAGDSDVQRLIAAAVAELNVRYPGDVGLEPLPATGHHFVAVVDGAAIGVVVLIGVRPGLDEVKRLYVEPGQRGRGVARSLIKALEDRANARGTDVVRLETGTRQPEAMALYESLGYSLIENYGQYAGSPLSRCYAKSMGSVDETSPSARGAGY
jgi:GNAT superfamily N-acetyltransferase